MPAHATAPDLLATLTAVQKRLTVLENQQNGGATDSNGIQRVAFGLLPSGDYGFAVTDALGTTTTEILPVYQAQNTTGVSTTSTSYVDLSPSVSVVAVVGASGWARVDASALITLPATTGGSASAGFVGVSIDGATPTAPLVDLLEASMTLNGSASGTMQVACTSTAVVAGLTPGSHTFALRYATAGGGTATTFSRRSLIVQPL